MGRTLDEGRVLGLLVLALVAIGAAACDGVTEPECLDCLLATEVRGVVKTDVDEAVAGARVSLVALTRAGEEGCARPSSFPPQVVETQTDEEGGFTAVVEAAAGADPACVEVVVVPPEGSNLISLTDTAEAAFVPAGDQLPTVEVQAELYGDRYVQVTANRWHTCALRIDGVVECWGENEGGQVPTRRKASIGVFTDVSTSAIFVCGVRSDGVVECWGDNQGGYTPSMRQPKTGSFIQVSTYGYTCALRDDGAVECWGINFAGQAPELKEAQVGSFVQVSTSSQHVCALRDDGVIECWGRDWVPDVWWPGGGPYVQIASGLQFTCAVRTDGVVRCDGADAYGITRTPSAGAFVQVTGGWFHMCGVRSDGAVECWENTLGGGNEHGEAPPLRAATEGTFRKVAAGYGHTCALRDDGVIECWGLNDKGQAPAIRRVGES